MTGTALATRGADGALRTADPDGDVPSGLVWTQERVQTLRSTLAKDCTPAQFELALAFCRRTGLDPFLRQVHIVVRQGQMTLQIGIDGHRAIALRSGVYAGEDGPLYCGKDGVYTDTWVSAEPPVAAKFTVWRHDYDRPFTAVVLFKEFAGLAGQSPLWKTAPVHMLGVRASSHGFRKAFQQELASHGRIARAMGVALESQAEPARELDVESERRLAAPAPQARVVEARARPAGAAHPAAPPAAPQHQLANRRTRIQTLAKRLRELGVQVPPPPSGAADLAALDAYGTRLRALVDEAEVRDAAGEPEQEIDELGAPESEWEPETVGGEGVEMDDDAKLAAYRRDYAQLQADAAALPPPHALAVPDLPTDATLNAVVDLFDEWHARYAEAQDALQAELANTPQPRARR